MLSGDHALRGQAIRALTDTDPAPYWLADPRRPRALPALGAALESDLLVIGGGYCGLWTALLAKERDPQREVVLLEAHESGWAASGRNGGFASASLTHGVRNGAHRWPEEIDTAAARLGEPDRDRIDPGAL